MVVGIPALNPSSSQSYTVASGHQRTMAVGPSAFTRGEMNMLWAAGAASSVGAALHRCSLSLLAPLGTPDVAKVPSPAPGMLALPSTPPPTPAQKLLGELAALAVLHELSPGGWGGRGGKGAGGLWPLCQLLPALTGAGLAWLFPRTAWKGATYRSTTEITNYFAEGLSCRQLSGRPWSSAGVGSTASHVPSPVLARDVAWGCPSCVHVSPASTGKGGTSDGGGGRGAPGARADAALCLPVSPLMLTPPCHPSPGDAQGPHAPKSTLRGLHAVLGAGTLGWHLHPATLSPVPLPEHLASSRTGGCAMPQFPLQGKAMGTHPGPCSPALPSSHTVWPCCWLSGCRRTQPC